MNLYSRLVVLFSLFCLLSLGLACGGGDDDDDDDQARDCATDDPLEITGTDPDSGFNLEEQVLNVTGGCFDDLTSARLIAAGGDEIELEATAPDNETLTVTVPAGIPVGSYTLSIARGDLSAETDYAAVSNILVTAGIDWAFYVVDVSDINNPREVLKNRPMGEGLDLGVPVVDATGTKVYFTYAPGENQNAIYRADLLDGGNVEQISPAVPAIWDSPDASPVGGQITAMGCSEVGNVCDIYVLPEDGGSATKVAALEEVLIIDGKETTSWAFAIPVYSPDGTKIAFLSDSLDGDGTHYDVIVVMNADGSDKQIAYWEEGGVHGYNWLNWTADDHLIWGRVDDELGTQVIYMLKVGETDAVQVTAPTDGFGDFVWLVYSPLTQGFMLQPAQTAEQVYYPVTIGGGITAGDGVPVRVPDPNAPGEYMAHYSTAEWFGWSN